MNQKNIRNLLLISLFSVIMHAQEDKSLPSLITDRPDQTESSSAVPVHYLQIETGFQYEKIDLGPGFRLREYTYNTTLLRYGLFKGFELRAGAEIVDFQTGLIPDENDPKAGFSPLLFGIKYEMVNENGWRPKIAILAQGLFPFIASDPYKPDHITTELRLAFSHTLSEKSGLSYNVGFEKSDFPDPIYFYSISYGYSFTNELAAFAEIYGDIPVERNANHSWNVGLTYLLSRNVQIDSYVGTGLNNNQDLLLGAGLSVRLPN